MIVYLRNDGSIELMGNWLVTWGYAEIGEYAYKAPPGETYDTLLARLQQLPKTGGIESCTIDVLEDDGTIRVIHGDALEIERKTASRTAGVS